jgi:hypothetical protein
VALVEQELLQEMQLQLEALVAYRNINLTHHLAVLLAEHQVSEQTAEAAVAEVLAWTLEATGLLETAERRALRVRLDLEAQAAAEAVAELITLA